MSPWKLGLASFLWKNQSVMMLHCCGHNKNANNIFSMSSFRTKFKKFAYRTEKKQRWIWHKSPWLFQMLNKMERQLLVTVIWYPTSFYKNLWSVRTSVLWRVVIIIFSQTFVATQCSLNYRSEVVKNTTISTLPTSKVAYFSHPFVERRNSNFSPAASKFLLQQSYC